MATSRQIAVGDVSPLAFALLAKSAVAASITGTLTETALGTITVPASTIGVNGQIRVSAYWSCTNSANNKTMRVRLGGIAGSVCFSTVQTTGNLVKAEIVIANRNSASSQLLTATAARPTDGLVTTTMPTPIAVDTGASQDLVISGQLANTGEIITLEGYNVEYVK